MVNKSAAANSGFSTVLRNIGIIISMLVVFSALVTMVVTSASKVELQKTNIAVAKLEESSNYWKKRLDKFEAKLDDMNDFLRENNKKEK